MGLAATRGRRRVTGEDAFSWDLKRKGHGTMKAIAAFISTFDVWASAVCNPAEALPMASIKLMGTGWG